MQYNTVVSGAMKLLNALEDFKARGRRVPPRRMREGFGILLRALYPACPHITHALWQDLGYADVHGDLLDAPWPQVDEAALVQDEIELMLQVNGKLRGAIKVPAARTRRRSRPLRSRHPNSPSSATAARQEGDRGAGPPGQCGGLTWTARTAPSAGRWRMRPCRCSPGWPAAAFACAARPT